MGLSPSSLNQQPPPAVKLLDFTSSHTLPALLSRAQREGGSLEQEHPRLPLFLTEVQQFFYEYIFLNVSFVLDQLSEPALK